MRAKMSIIVLLIGLANAEANLVVNGDFEQGDTGFESLYTYGDGEAGCYAIGEDSKAWNINFPDPTFDHTSGSGLMLMANGHPEAGTPVWSQSVSVTADVEYQFSAWYAALNKLYSSPHLEFLVDGDSLGSVTGTYNIWEQFSGSWTAPISGDVTLSIRDTVADPSGNDFALDDLTFEVIPEPASAIFFTMSAVGGIWIRRKFSI